MVDKKSMTNKKNKKEIINTLAEKHGLTQVQVYDVLHSFFEEVVLSLENFGVIELRNFGVFKVKKRKPRIARNPRNNVEVEIGERFVVTFKPGREMTERVQKAKVEAPKQKRRE
ncbi:MAG: integration host factor subunit beta [Candidatus Heimdallarchaeota archaeon]|nr:integration host factor subunit beta [Candidatus Heimdallarchaeota archaeon]